MIYKIIHKNFFGNLKKRIFGLILLVCLVASFGSMPTYATSDTTSSIFKIQAYSYNTVSQMYELEQYGSAVLVAPNILLTNAHVVTDADDKFTLQYEACQTISSSEAPSCFSTLQLLSYDKSADLALLKIVSPTENMPNPVTLGSGTLAVGSAITIVGYPANGGESITTTQGTIAGYEQGYYKTDANIDGGNSGGGGFDSAGNFIGIPTFVVNGQTTLGYLIPINVIRGFLSGDTGIAATQKVSPLFTKWLTTQYGLADVQNIDNDLFSTPDFSEYNLSLINATEKKTNNLYEYVLDADSGSQIRLQSVIATDDAAIQKYISAGVKSAKSLGRTVQKLTKKIGSTSFQVLVGIDEDIVIYDYVQTHSSNKTYLEFVILVDKDKAKTDLANLINFVDAMTVKKSTSKPQALSFPGITLSSKRGVSIIKVLDGGELSISLLQKSDNFTIDISAYPASKGMTIKKIMNSIESTLDDMDMEYTSETSKYPSKVLFITTTDGDGKVGILAMGTTKTGSSSVFIQCNVSLRSLANKKDAMTMVYKVLGLE